MTQALDAAFVTAIHDEILAREHGLSGFGGPGASGLEGALARGSSTRPMLA